jgi:hypothetical protein
MKKTVGVALITAVLSMSITCSLVFANIEDPLVQKREMFEAPFRGLTENKIEFVQISGHFFRRTFNAEDIKSFVSLINEVNKEDISEYKGPAPKGGPISLTVFLRTNEKFTLIINGEYFLFSEKTENYQAYQPELCKFAISLLK